MLHIIISACISIAAVVAVIILIRNGLYDIHNDNARVIKALSDLIIVIDRTSKAAVVNPTQREAEIYTPNDEYMSDLEDKTDAEG